VKKVVISLLAGGLWVFYRGKSPENAEFAIVGAILDVRKTRSGASDSEGKGMGEPKKNRLIAACPKTRLP